MTRSPIQVAVKPLGCEIIPLLCVDCGAWLACSHDLAIVTKDMKHVNQ